MREESGGWTTGSVSSMGLTSSALSGASLLSSLLSVFVLLCGTILDGQPEGSVAADVLDTSFSPSSEAVLVDDGLLVVDVTSPFLVLVGF